MIEGIKERKFLICSLEEEVTDSGKVLEPFNYAMKELHLEEGKVVQIAYNYDSMLKEIVKNN
tara:strand:+ start:36 stop:221 length:186 start_codon:yes stop_codon:yes gene_type:complete